MAPDSQNDIPEQLEKELERALKRAKFEIKLKAAGQPPVLAAADGAALAEDQDEPDSGKPDYYGQVESPSGDNLSALSPALDVGKKSSVQGPSSFDEPSGDGDDNQPGADDSPKPPSGDKKSKSIGPGPQEQPLDEEAAAGEAGKDGAAGSTDNNDGAAAGGEEGEAADGEAGQTAAGQPDQAPGQTDKSKQRKGLAGQWDKQMAMARKRREFRDYQKEEKAPGDQKKEGEGGAAGEEQPEPAGQAPENGEESAPSAVEQSDKTSARALKKEKAEQKKRLKEREQAQAKAVVEQAIKKVSSKFGLRSLNYGCGASLIGVLVPFIIMNAQLAFTLFPILLKILPVPKNLAGILKFEFGDIGDMFDLLLIILIDVLLGLAIMLIFGIIYWIINTTLHPFEFSWAVIESLLVGD